MNKSHKFAIIISIIASITAFSAQAEDYSGSGYNGAETRQMSDVVEGTVQAVRVVSIQGQPSTSMQVVGGSLGGLVGGLLGSNMGKGNGTYAATAVLGVLGAAAGTYGTEVLAKDKGVEFIVKLDNGRVVAISQGVDEESQTIRQGDRVHVIQGYKTRVIKA